LSFKNLGAWVRTRSGRGPPRGAGGVVGGGASGSVWGAVIGGASGTSSVVVSELP
jgi:hypothetical protein